MAIERKIKIYNFDLDRDGEIRPSALMHYFQQLALSDCDSVGLTYAAMRAAGQVFVLTKSKLALFEPAALYDELLFKSWATRTKGASFEREFEVMRGDERLAACTTQWVLIDFAERKILRPSELIGMMPNFPDRHCGIEMPGRLSVHEELVPCGERRVYYSMIDENRHLNNSFYSDIALDCAENKKVSAIQINYLDEAYEGNTVEIFRTELPDGSLYMRGHNKTLERPCFEALLEY